MKKDGKKGFTAEFKEFITRGNVVDMAVGVIVGSAFTAIVTSLVDNIFNPVIGYFIGGVNFTDLSIPLPRMIPGADPVTVNYGAFIQQVVNFLIIAFVVFCMVRLINRLRRKKDESKAEEKAAAEPEISPEVRMLTEIRDILKEKATNSEK